MLAKNVEFLPYIIAMTVVFLLVQILIEKLKNRKYDQKYIAEYTILYNGRDYTREIRLNYDQRWHLVARLSADSTDEGWMTSVADQKFYKTVNKIRETVEIHKR